MSQPYVLVGFEQAVRRLKRLPTDLQKKGLRSAVRKGAAVVRNAALANARALDDSETKNAIWKNIVVQTATRLGKKGGGVAFRVGVLGGARAYANTRANRREGRVGKTYATGGDKGNPGGDTFYFRFLEFGTKRGIPATEFLTKALQANVDRATEEVATALKLELDKIDVKLGSAA